MTFRLVDKGWGQVLREAAATNATMLRIICPLIKRGALLHLSDGRPAGAIQVTTRFSLASVAGRTRMMFPHGMVPAVPRPEILRIGDFCVVLVGSPRKTR